MSGLVLSLCDRTGNMVLPWLEAGWRAVTVDLEPAVNPHGNRTHVVSDVRRFVLRHRPSIVFAFPPCTHLASSGARWFRSKGLPALTLPAPLVAAVAGDYDNDERTDLFVLGEKQHALLHQRADGTFEDTTKAAGIPAPAGSSATVAFVDADHDGRRGGDERDHEKYRIHGVTSA